MPEEIFIPITEAARIFVVDPETLVSSLQKEGVKIFRFGERSRRIQVTDFERIKREGLNYYNDKIPCPKK